MAGLGKVTVKGRTFEITASTPEPDGHGNVTVRLTATPARKGPGRQP